jgi:Ran-binding protein 3
MKIRVRQISQGVEDLSWRNMTATTSERGGEEDSAVTPPAARAVETSSPDMKAGDVFNGKITTGLGLNPGYPNP